LYDGGDSPKGLNSEWLASRLKLFEQFCYPALAKQSSQQFKWLVLLDSRTPEWLKDRMRETAQWRNFVPTYLDFPLPEEAGCPDALKTEISGQVGEGVTRLITTRIDNDDAVSNDFLERIQACVPSRAKEGLVFPLGYQLHEGYLHLDYSRGNHFISLSEPYRPGVFDTVFTRAHNELYRSVPVRQIWTAPTWLEVLHGGNIANHPSNGPVVSPAGFRRRFCCPDVQLHDIAGLSLLARQARFATLGAPRYVLTKAFNRMKYHGPWARDAD
jgi:hypothetical protein